MDDEFKALYEEIQEYHKTLSKYVGKEHWSIAGRVDGLVLMLANKFMDLAHNKGNAAVVEECMRLLDLVNKTM